MRIKRARQILKSFADDTRLRIINLLNQQELTVTKLCKILDKNQSSISKHLTRLRLTGIVGDKRDGLNVYYRLARPESNMHRELINIITTGLKNSEVFLNDLRKLKGIKLKSSKKRYSKKIGGKR